MSDYPFENWVLQRDRRRAPQQIEPALPGKQIAICHGVPLRTVRRWARTGKFARWRELPGGKVEVPVSAYQEFVERENRRGFCPAKANKLIPGISARKIAQLHSVTLKTVCRWMETGWFGRRSRPETKDPELPLDVYLQFREDGDRRGIDYD